MTDRDQDRGLRFAGLGFEFAASVAGLTLLGYWFDRHYDSSPWGVLVGAAIGLIGGTYNLIRDALTANRGVPSARSEPIDPQPQAGMKTMSGADADETARRSEAPGAGPADGSGREDGT